MLEGMLLKKKSGDFFLHIDPSGQNAGATTILDLRGRQSINNSGVIVDAEGPFSGMKSLRFDGRSGYRPYFSVPPANLVNILTGDFTIEFWAKVVSTPSGGNLCLLGHWIQLAAQGGWIIWYKNGTISFSWGPSGEGTGANLMSGNITVSVGTWFHLAVVRIGAVFTLYINGKAAASATTFTTRGKINASISAAMYQNGSGTYPDSISNIFNGKLANIKLIAGVGRYTGNFTPDP